MSKYYKRYFAAIALSIIVACINSPFGCGMLFSVIMFGIGTNFSREAHADMEYILPEGINPDQDTPEHVSQTYQRAQSLVKYIRENFE